MKVLMIMPNCLAYNWLNLKLDPQRDFLPPFAFFKFGASQSVTLSPIHLFTNVTPHSGCEYVMHLTVHRASENVLMGEVWGWNDEKAMWGGRKFCCGLSLYHGPLPSYSFNPLSISPFPPTCRQKEPLAEEKRWPSTSDHNPHPRFS